MKLYHGTNHAFDKIDLMKSKPNKDFGRGFYLSPNYEQAFNMANIKTEQQKDGGPVVLTYEVDESELETLNVRSFEKYSEEWAEFILANRSNATGKAVHQYDVVIGPIADDRIGVQLWKYENQLIDLHTLVEKLKYMKGMTIQYFFGTEKAISLLKRIDV